LSGNVLANAHTHLDPHATVQTGFT
jgi:hypothetical protein